MTRVTKSETTIDRGRQICDGDRRIAAAYENYRNAIQRRNDAFYAAEVIASALAKASVEVDAAYDTYLRHLSQRLNAKDAAEGIID